MAIWALHGLAWQKTYFTAQSGCFFRNNTYLSDVPAQQDDHEVISQFYHCLFRGKVCADECSGNDKKATVLRQRQRSLFVMQSDAESDAHHIVAPLPPHSVAESGWKLPCAWQVVLTKLRHAACPTSPSCVLPTFVPRPLHALGAVSDSRTLLGELF